MRISEQSETAQGMQLPLHSCYWLALIAIHCLCRLCLTPPTTMFQRFVAGGVAGAISRTVVAPLERLRTMVRPVIYRLKLHS